jgi:COMPASS component SWD3
MDSTRSPSPKRRREDEDGYDDERPRKRSASHEAPNASPSYRIAERPARRYSRGDSEDERGEYSQRRPSYSPSPSPSRRSSSSSSSRRHRPCPPSKPTSLNYAPTLILRGHKKAISCVKFSPDGRYIASASADCTIKIWDARTGALEHTLEGHLAGISTICWSLDSKILASGSDDKSIRLWDTATGLAHPTPFIGHHNYVYSIAFSPKGNMLVSGSYDEAVYLWDVRAARVMRSLPAHSDPVGGVDFVRDGTLIVSCSHDGLIRVWDTATGQCLRTLVHEDNASVSSVIFSPNGKYILAWTLDSCVRLWNYIEGKGKCVKTYQGHVNKQYSLSGAFGTYGDKEAGGQEYAFIASGDEEGQVVLWDVSSKNVLQRLEGHTDAVLSVHTHPTEKLIVSAGLDRTIRLWRPKEGKEVDGEKSDEGEGKVNGEGPVNEIKEEDTNGFDPDLLPPNPFAEA